MSSFFKELPRERSDTDCLFHRRLTSRQHSLILSYAEDETDVEGTVNGVTNTSTGKAAWPPGRPLVPRDGGLEACQGYHLRVSMDPQRAQENEGS